jgi:hypothetical protein
MHGDGLDGGDTRRCCGNDGRAGLRRGWRRLDDGDRQWCERPLRLLWRARSRSGCKRRDAPCERCKREHDRRGASSPRPGVDERVARRCSAQLDQHFLDRRTERRLARETRRYDRGRTRVDRRSPRGRDRELRTAPDRDGGSPQNAKWRIAPSDQMSLSAVAAPSPLACSALRNPISRSWSARSVGLDSAASSPMSIPRPASTIVAQLGVRTIRVGSSTPWNAPARCKVRNPSAMYVAPNESPSRRVSRRKRPAIVR